MIKKAIGVVILLALPLFITTGHANQTDSSQHYHNSIMQQADMLFVTAKETDFAVQSLFPNVEQAITNYSNTEHAMLLGFNWNNNIP